ncbi:uncharacterized protein A4U43_C09F2050 [Asparagus officinalis]|uniref:Uncharacterized protein n=1 Tax=Asparagus officinalis TaxID=4686 RepID=A0A5P1E4V5_ASPOF|nr:uncharacterized protein A4U43_C09F2050 [Asparagus officinalis]
MRRTIIIRILFSLNLSIALHLLGCQAQGQGSEEASGRRTLKQHSLPKHEVHCSRERSRIAWGIIDEYLMPFVEHEEYQIPSKCRLHPDNDMFREQEQHKIHVDTNEWRCGFYLCGALHCGVIAETRKTKNKCNPAATAKNRHLCESLADSCFPINQGPSASRLHELFLRQFCDSHSCDGGKKPFSRGGRKQPSVFYLACCILIVLLLPVFYLLVYLHQREMQTGIQGLKRISKTGRKTKPS